jgi:hypothetical protein
LANQIKSNLENRRGAIGKLADMKTQANCRDVAVESTSPKYITFGMLNPEMSGFQPILSLNDSEDQEDHREFQADEGRHDNFIYMEEPWNSDLPVGQVMVDAVNEKPSSTKPSTKPSSNGTTPTEEDDKYRQPILGFNSTFGKVCSRAEIEVGVGNDQEKPRLLQDIVSKTMTAIISCKRKAGIRQDLNLREEYRQTDGSVIFPSTRQDNPLSAKRLSCLSQPVASSAQKPTGCLRKCTGGATN